MSIKNGMIKKLTLSNFQTYRKATFSFAATLNFIVGPNGSGKSSIANAISLIFGGTPKTYVKSRDGSDYIRFDANEAYIEVEIYYDPSSLEDITKYTVKSVNSRGSSTKSNGTRTCKLKRVIRRGTNLWYIDNRPVKKNEYMAFIEKLKLKVDNLCQFLPQEKVSEFSRLTPEGLLDETLDALNYSEILRMKRELAIDENNLSKMDENLKYIMKTKDNMQTIVDNIEKDVEKVREMERKKFLIQLMEKKKWWIEFKMKQNEYAKIKDMHKKVEKEIALKEEEVANIAEEISRLKVSGPSKKLDSIVEELNKNNALLSSNVEELKGRKRMEEMLDVDLKSISGQRVKRENDIKQLEIDIDNIKSQLSKIVIEEKPKLDLKVKNELEEKISELRRKQGQVSYNSSDIQRRMAQLQTMKDNLKERNKRRMEMLRRYHNDTYSAVLWLRENKHNFRGEIIEPLFLSIHLKNKEYAVEVENFLQFSTLTSFICFDSGDFETFNKICKDDMKLSINVVEMVKEVPKTKYTSEEVKGMGFAGLLTDFIEVRKEVMDFLCVYGHFDAIPITKKNINEMEILKRYSFKKMAKNNRYIEIKRSRYNKDDYTIIDNALTGKGIFNTDFSKLEVEKIDEELNDLDTQRKTNEAILKELYSENAKVEQLLKEEYKRHSAIKARISVITSMIVAKEGLTNRLEEYITALHKLEDFTDFDNRVAEIEREKKDVQKAYGKFVEKFYADLRDERYISKLSEAVKLTQKMDEHFKQIMKLEEKMAITSQSILDIRDSIDELNKSRIDVKEALLEMKRDAGLYELDSDESEKIRDLPEDCQTLEREIAKERVKMTFLNANDRILAEHKSKSKELAAIVREYSARDTSKKNLEKNISQVKSKVVADIRKILDDISDIFSELFSRFNCEGKIVFGDYDQDSSKWKLNIMVRFREGESLEVLSSFRQSGGEKSVATILYLLALQKFMPVPFRLVDEINQGMDAYNERLMHDVLVGLSEEPNATQFFIITPKIVSGLNYSDTMKIIVLYSGKFQFDPSTAIDYKNAVIS